MKLAPAVARSVTPIALLAGLSACASIPPDSDGIARAGIAQTAYVGGPKVTPLAVMEDSRCPQRTQCAWAGQVRILVRIETGAGSQTKEMTSGKPVQVMDGLLELVETRPHPVAGAAPIASTDYTFGFRFTPGA